MKKKTTRTLTPKLLFPEFREEPGWEEAKLSQLGKLVSGLTYSPKDVRDNGLLVLRSSNIQNGEITLDDCVYVTPTVKGANLAKPKDILICVRNGSKPLIGKNAMIPEGIPKCTHGAFMTVLRAHAAYFVFQLLQTSAFQKQVAADLGATINSINSSNLLKYRFFVPSEPLEQERIADCLAALDTQIAAEGRKLEALRDHKRGLIQQLFPQPGQTQPRLRFPKFRDNGEWEESPLGRLLSRKPEYGVNAAAVPFSEDLPTYIRITDIDDEGQFTKDNRVSVDIEATEENYLVEGDIVLARTGASVGKSYRYRPKDGRLVFAGFLIRVRPNPKKLVPDLLSNYLTTWQYWDWVRVSSARSGQPGINGSEYASMPVPLPPAGPKGNELAEQQKIADCLTALDTQIAAQAAKIESLKTHKRGLMQQLFPSPQEIEA